MTGDIETLNPKDRAAAERLLRDAFAPYVAKLGRRQAPDAYEWLPEALAEGRVYGLRDGPSLIGVAITIRDTAGWTLDQVAVAPEYQGSGIGSRLIGHVEAEARRHGAPVLFLDTAAMMTDLLRLYRRLGFEERHRGLAEHGCDDHERVYMQKRL